MSESQLLKVKKIGNFIEVIVMKNLVTLLGLLAVIATPVKAQEIVPHPFRQIISEYGRVGNDVGYLLCEAADQGIDTNEKIIFYVIGKLAEEHRMIFANVINLSEEDLLSQAFVETMNSQLFNCQDQIIDIFSK